MVESDPVTEVAREFASDLRSVMGAVLRAKPRHVRLLSANAQSVRCVFDAAADGFLPGQHVTAELTTSGPRVRVSISSAGDELQPRVQASLQRFFDEVERGLSADCDTLPGC